MKKIIFVLAAVFAVASASAQSKQWTLRECIDYAVENNIDVRQTELGVRRAELNLNSTQMSRLPSLNFGASHGFSFGRSIGEQNTYETTRTMSTSLSASTSVPVFEGFRINNQTKVDRFDLKAAAAGLERAKESVELGVAGYYLDVLFKKEVLEVYRKQSELTREQVANTQKMVDEGRVARAQLLDIEAQSARADVNLTGAENDLALSLLNLSQALNLPQTDEFDVAAVDDIFLSDANAATVGVPTPDEIYATALDVKPAIRQAQYGLQSAEMGVKVARAAFWPTLSLGASASDNYYYRFGAEYKQASFFDQLRNNHGQSVGLNLSVPIFNGNRARNAVKGAKLTARNSALELDAAKLALRKEIEQAWQRVASARARFDATTRALAASEEAFRAMELRYNNGKATAYEFAEANTALVEARSNAAQARFDYLFGTKIVDFYLGRRIEL